MTKVEDILANRRKKNDHDLENRIISIYKKIPEIKEIDSEIKKLNILRISDSIEGKDVNYISENIERLIQRKNRLLDQNNIPADYLDKKYHCENCKDTGVYEMKICNCRKQLILDELYNQSEISERIKAENFDKFNFELFRKNRMSNEKLSPYDNMKKLFNNARDYAESFNTKSPNLYLYGAVGTGKTYMVNCIAKAILDRGFSVLYQSVNELIDNLSTYQFSYSNEKISLKKKIDFIYNVDLLIIDDLGTEIISEMSKSLLFEILNKRIVKRKPMVISSNIEPFDIADYYDARIYSRVNGNFLPMYFYGNDVRLS
ncbi:MAG: ATP-binding protein [Tissierellia bacterium]|nr:ATP-binding protein [Tissierellia bacterium]